MADAVCKHKGDRVLLVEGLNDCHVVMAICGVHSLPENFGLYECGGRQQLLKRLNALISAPDRPRIIGAVLDADSGVAERWTSFSAKLQHHGYVFPSAPDAQGTIIDATLSLPRLGLWLMPDNQATGIIEDFCIEMMAVRARGVAGAAVRGAQAEGVCTFKPAHFSKALVHTYLAWQDEPGRPLGQAITAQALSPNTETALSFVSWLTRLFGIS